jgi:hypothetical protein
VSRPHGRSDAKLLAILGRRSRLLQWVIERLIDLADRIRDVRIENRDLADNALRAISTALTETYIYYRGLDRGNQRSADIEEQLARYWAAAAIPLRHIDARLAERCDRKAEYWLNPDGWSRAQVTKAGIALDDVRKKYRALLLPKNASKKRRARAARD